MKVLAAMSGGVDSAVAAARAVDAGQDVTGIHLALSSAPQSHRTGARGCCTLEDARDARRAADTIGIPFYVWDLAERFAADVMDDFLGEYAAGRTPNPCVRCNERIKFAAVLDRALALGFDAVVTGHHAQLAVDGGRPELRRSVDLGKDQSYVLGTLQPEQLSRAIFPLGDDPRDACRRALTAAEQALAALEASNASRAHPVHVGVGLHRGQVMYGNIGARDRLDFTVIGASVNESARLEGLCKTLGVPLVISAAFAQQLKESKLKALGQHALSGVAAPAEVFTIE